MTTEFDQPPSFARDIRPLFRTKDRESMHTVFDLWQYQDVKQHADGIYKRISDGSMPCDGAWPADKVQRLRRWIMGGCQP